MRRQREERNEGSKQYEDQEDKGDAVDSIKDDESWVSNRVTQPDKNVEVEGAAAAQEVSIGTPAAAAAGATTAAMTASLAQTNETTFRANALSLRDYRPGASFEASVVKQPDNGVKPEEEAPA